MKTCRFGIARWCDAALELPKSRPFIENVIEISDEVAKLTLRIVPEHRDRARRPGDLQERHGLPLAMLWALNNPAPEGEVLFAIRAVRKNGAAGITPPALQVPWYPLIPGSQEQPKTPEDGHGHRYSNDPDATPDAESSRRDNKLATGLDQQAPVMAALTGRGASDLSALARRGATRAQVLRSVIRQSFLGSHDVLEEARHRLLHNVPRLADVLLHANPAGHPQAHDRTSHHRRPPAT